METPMHAAIGPRRALGLASLTLAALLAGQCAPARAAGSVLFHAHWQVGQHFSERQITTSIQKFSITIVGTKQSFAQKQITTDSFTVTITFIKVNRDGSADAKITFPSGTHNDGTKTVHVPMAHYYRIQHIRPDGETTSTKTFGASTVPAALRDSIPDTTTYKFPSKPIAVGGTWENSRSIAPFGTLTLHNTVVSAGTKNGHPVATIHSVLAQKARIDQNGLTFAGVFHGVQDQQLYTDSFESVAPTHSSYGFAGKISGKANGTPVKGSFDFSGTETDTPLP
jgi:hypothetical protein